MFAVEVSDGLVARLRQCGFTAVKTTRASPAGAPRPNAPSMATGDPRTALRGWAVLTRRSADPTPLATPGIDQGAAPRTRTQRPVALVGACVATYVRTCGQNAPTDRHGILPGLGLRCPVQIV